MRVIKAGYEILTPINRLEILKTIEVASRVCYKSESNITEESASKMVKNLIKSGHTAMIEHASISVKFICDRGVSHEIVRHRIASFAQESTRYCDYSKNKFDKQITFIKPLFYKEGTPNYTAWKETCERCEATYFWLLNHGSTPQEARSVLPNSLKTEIVVTMNLREWIHFFKLRAVGTTGKPHPQMTEITIPLLNELKALLPEIFGDIEVVG